MVEQLETCNTTLDIDESLENKNIALDTDETLEYNNTTLEINERLEETNRTSRINERIANRNTTLDIVRIASVLLVMMVHFFLYTGFYSEPMEGPVMFLMCFMRTFFSACVPMFILLSGYLMSKKTVSKKHFFGISKTLLTYFVAGVACLVFNILYKHQTYTFKEAILSFFDFSAANYAWYVEMYIGLFLLVPFLNLIYNNLKSQRLKQLLVLTFVFLTAVPTFFNVYNLTNPAWWSNPSSSKAFNALLPDWWIGFYPVTFYFTGCYLKEFGLKLKTKTVAFLLVLTTLAFSAFNFWRSHGVGFITSTYAYWYGFQPYVTAVLLFELLTRIKCEKTSKTTRFVLWKISDLVFCMYLVSYIFDTVVYERLKLWVPVMQDRIIWFIPCVAIVFVLSLFLSLLLHYVELIFKTAFNFISDVVKTLKSRDSKYVVDLCFIVMMLSFLILNLWKAPYGFGGYDEPFYLTVAHRLGLGDFLFVDEWNLSQMSGLLLMPFVWLYRVLTGGTEGILLTFRYIYIIVHLLVTMFAYKRLRKYGYIAAVGISLFYLFTPYNIMALSYNTMTLDLLLVGGVLLATSTKNWQFVISGLCFAGAVLCYPYLVLVYVIYLLCVIAHLILKKTKIRRSALCTDMFSLKTFLWFTLGVSILAAIFLIFILCTCGISGIIDNLPLILNDPKHPQTGILAKLKSYANAILNCHPRFKISLYCYLATLVAMAIDRNRKNHRAFYLIVSAVITLMTLFMFYPTLTTKKYNSVMLPLIFVGTTSYILCKKKPQKIFCCTFITGLIYSLCASISSNQYFYIISVAFSLSNVASYIFLAQVLKEMKERPDEVAYGRWLYKGTALTAAFVISIIALMQFEVKTQHCFWENGSPKTLTSQMTTGPAKGIFTNTQNANTYETLSADLDSYNNVKDGDILILTINTWCYLKTEDLPYGSFSAWITEENYATLSRLEQFYSVNPDKIPEYIYIPKDSEFGAARIARNAQSKGYAVIENDVSYKLSRIN